LLLVVKRIKPIFGTSTLLFVEFWPSAIIPSKFSNPTINTVLFWTRAYFHWFLDDLAAVFLQVASCFLAKKAMQRERMTISGQKWMVKIVEIPFFDDIGVRVKIWQIEESRGQNGLLSSKIKHNLYWQGASKFLFLDGCVLCVFGQGCYSASPFVPFPLLMKWHSSCVFEKKMNSNSQLLRQKNSKIVELYKKSRTKYKVFLRVWRLIPVHQNIAVLWTEILMLSAMMYYTCSKAFAFAPGTPYQHFGSPLKHNKNNHIVI